MPYTFNPFSGTFDNTPSTLEGSSAYSTLCALSAEWLTNAKASASFLSLSGGTLTGSVSISGDITGINNSHLIDFILDGGSY